MGHSSSLALGTIMVAGLLHGAENKQAYLDGPTQRTFSGRTRACDEHVPSEQRRNAVGDSLARLALANDQRYLALDTLAVYASIDTTGSVLESSSAEWVPGRLVDKVDVVLPKTAAGKPYESGGYVLLNSGRPFAGRVRVLLGWVLICK